MDPVVIAQFFGGGDQWWSWILWIAFMGIFFMFYPRIMLFQIMGKLERTVADLERMSNEGKQFLLKEINKNDKVSKDAKAAVDRFYEFFLIQPVGLDPYGIVKKFDHMTTEQRKRFSYTVKQIMPHATAERRACIEMGFAGGISLYQVTKMVKHYVELAKKTKSFQIAMILQMQLPLIERIAKSLSQGTRALAQGQPVGDSIGPYTVAKLMGDSKAHEVEEDIMMVKKRIKGHDVFLIKAKGPGGRLGRPGKAVEKIAKQHKIEKIISIDAAAKLEGEKTGAVAEGVGVAMGGIGVERTYIENTAVHKSIPLDSVIVKMSPEQAIEPMRKAIKDAYPKVLEGINRSLEEMRPHKKAIIVGVGNTTGVGQDGKSAKKMEEWVDQYERKYLASQKNKKKKKK